MPIEIVFETHALTEDNERGIATGWLPGRLSERGRVNAAEIGRRRRDDGNRSAIASRRPTILAPASPKPGSWPPSSS
jgi:2,3-bisphosphoglycerate-dependent phosphoglycerate mutase